MTLAEWKRREDLQGRLDATLNEAHMLNVVSVLTQMGLPKGTELPDINLNALRNAYNEGYFRCLANLELLRAIKEPEVKPMPQPWVREAEKPT